MQTTTSWEIIKQLKTDLKKISRSNNYYTDILEIKEGLYTFEDFTSTPGLFIHEVKDEILERLFGNKTVQQLQIMVRLFMKNEYIDDTSPINKFVHDIQKFLTNSDFTYNEDTILDNNVDFYKGGISDPVLIATLQVGIHYSLQL